MPAVLIAFVHYEILSVSKLFAGSYATSYLGIKSQLFNIVG